jgi:hypothetical protein
VIISFTVSLPRPPENSAAQGVLSRSSIAGMERSAVFVVFILEAVMMYLSYPA